MRVSALFLAAAAICSVSALSSHNERSSLDSSYEPVGTISHASTGRQSRKTKRSTTPSTTTRTRRQNRRDALRERSAQALVQRAQDVNSLMDQLSTLHDGLLASQQNMHKLKQRTAKQKGKASGPFKSEVSNELRRYRSQYKQTTPVINELSEALSDFGGDKGLRHYNKDSQLQTMLKEIVDSVKYTLNDVNYIAFKIPALGGVLGPLVYDVKCLVDVLLNGSENTVDHILNNYAGDLKDIDSLLGLSLASLGGGGLPL